jgi:hypothetical protein
MASTKKLSTTLHRSRQKIPFARREHLHDGLRMMVSDIPREHGWLIQRSTTNVLIAEADECEEELYKGPCLPCSRSVCSLCLTPDCHLRC